MLLLIGSIGVCAASVRAQLGVHSVARPGGEAGTSAPNGKVAARSTRPNILIVLMDDVGIDLVGAYGADSGTAHTPVIDELASEGLLFRHAWSEPSCSATRAMMLTGRYGFRTGVNRAIAWNTDWELADTEVSVADALSDAGYRTAAVGKWHLAVKSLSGTTHALNLGFEHFWGTVSNFPEYDPSDTYFSHYKVVDREVVHSEEYATSEQVDDALTLIDEFGSDPWFLWLAFNAPHAPYHVPPQDLQTYELEPPPASGWPLYVRAALEALDTELGRLLSSMDPATLANTVVVVTGDNGTPKDAKLPPLTESGSKGNLEEGGPHVPLIIVGPGVAQGEECDALVSLVDIFATSAELAGADATAAIDSVSLVPFFTDPSLPSQHQWLFAETFGPNGFATPKPFDKRAARGERYKLIATFNNSISPVGLSFYDLQTDPFEANNLIAAAHLNAEQQNAFHALLSVMQRYQPW